MIENGTFRDPPPGSKSGPFLDRFWGRNFRLFLTFSRVSQCNTAEKYSQEISTFINKKNNIYKFYKNIYIKKYL